MKFAFFGVPHMGGTHTVYRRLRDGLAARGTRVLWLGAGPRQAALADAARHDPCLAGDLADGTIVAPAAAGERAQAEALVRHLEEAGYDGVFVNVLSDRAATNAVRYLDERLLRVMIVHNITPGTYAAAAAVRDHVHAAVAVSPRIASDLVRRHGFDPDRLRVVFNAVDTAGPDRLRLGAARSGPLRLLFLGRIENASKGVFLLPRIMAALADRPVELAIAGGGPDEAELRARCARFGDRVRFLGGVPQDRVPALTVEHDVLLFPSYFEGFGLTLAEAMAGGCVPVAARIAGVTDRIVTDGGTGLLHPVGDAAAAAAAVRRLETDRSLLDQLAAAARQDVNARFSVDAMTAGYADLLADLQQSRPVIAPSRPASQWSVPRQLRPGLRTYLPAPVKTMARRLIERLAVARETPS